MVGVATGTGRAWSPQQAATYAGAAARSYWNRNPERLPFRRTSFSPSDAGKCSRQIGFKARGAAHDPGRELSPAARLTLVLGHAIEWRVLRQLETETQTGALPGTVDTQVRVDYTIATANGPLRIRGYADLVHTLPDGTRVVVDIKTMAQYGYIAAAVGTEDYGTVTPPQGPSDEYAMQTAMYAVGLWADTIAIAAVPRDPVTGFRAKLCADQPELAAAADFTMPLADMADALDAEYDRIAGVMRLAATEQVAKARIPGLPSEILGWDQIGNGIAYTPEGVQVKEWACRYCPYAQRCQTYGPGRHDFVSLEGDAA